MNKITDEKLDQDLYQALAFPEEVPAGLNDEIKRKIRQPSSEKTVNLWFFLIYANAAMTLLSEITIIFLISIPIIQILAVIHIILSFIAVGALLLLGRKYPALKEGASLKYERN